MMDDLVAFLNARYDEDEARAKGHGPRVVVYGKNGRPVPPVPAFTGGYSARRVLAEVAAKRQIIAEYEAVHAMHNRFDVDAELERMGTVLRLLALPYADHPDYRQEWRP